MQAQSKKIIDKLQNLNIREYDTRVKFGTKLTQFIAQYDNISTESLSSNNSIAYFENSIKSVSTVASHFNSWKTSYRLTKNKDPEFKDYKAEMLRVLPNIDLQQPQRGKPLTQSINVMHQDYDYDSADKLDTAYNVLFAKCENNNKQTMVEVMQVLRRTGKPVWHEKPNPNAMLAPKTWKKAPPEFKRLWLELKNDFTIEMLNQGMENSDPITTLPAPNAAFLANMLFDVNKASATYDLDDSGYETVHKDQDVADNQDTITVLNTLVNKAKHKLDWCSQLNRESIPIQLH